MNLPLVVYRFVKNLTEQSTSEKPLANAEALWYERASIDKAAGTKIVRVGRMQGSQPRPLTEEKLMHTFALVTVQFLQIPLTQKNEHRIEAYETAFEMAEQFCLAVWNYQNLNTACDTVKTARPEMVADFLSANGIEIPACAVRLLINEI